MANTTNTTLSFHSFPTVASSKSQFGSSTYNINSRAAETIKQTTKELANSEATVGLSWLPGHPYCIAAGTGVKWLRIYDMRIRMCTLAQSVA
jgi:hypothetical protein